MSSVGLTYQSAYDPVNFYVQYTGNRSNVDSVMYPFAFRDDERWKDDVPQLKERWQVFDKDKDPFDVPINGMQERVNFIGRNVQTHLDNYANTCRKCLRTFTERVSGGPVTRNVCTLLQWIDTRYFDAYFAINYFSRCAETSPVCREGLKQAKHVMIYDVQRAEDSIASSIGHKTEQLFKREIAFPRNIE